MQIMIRFLCMMVAGLMIALSVGSASASAQNMQMGGQSRQSYSMGGDCADCCEYPTGETCADPCHAACAAAIVPLAGEPASGTRFAIPAAWPFHALVTISKAPPVPPPR